MTSSTPGSESGVEPWQVRIAYVEFADRPGKGKARPILILKVGEGIDALKVTTNANAPFPVIDLRRYELGLRKPSWLQLTPLFDIDRDDVGPLIGNAPPSLRKVVRGLLA